VNIAPLNKWIPGALTNNQVKQLCRPGWVENVSLPKEQAGYSALDLTLSDEGYRLRVGCIKPFGEAYDQLLKNPAVAERLHKRKSYVLEPKQSYVFRLRERLGPKLLTSRAIYGQATAKSSVGRVDVLARLIVDGMNSYEQFDPEVLERNRTTGQMYLEITPITFRVRVREGIALSQLRLFYGRPEDCEIDGKELFDTVLVGSGFKDGSLSVDLSETTIVGKQGSAFCATTGLRPVVPLWKGGGTNPKKFWSLLPSAQLSAEAGVRKSLKIEKDAFYILRSKEKISLPAGIAVYCRAIDETIGEMRIHYAGFVHPLFGRERADWGTPLIFEVRGHDVQVTLTDGEKMARLTFYRMSEDVTPSTEQSGYEEQTLQLSGFFSKWT
jgi:dCTP deaminase